MSFVIEYLYSFFATLVAQPQGELARSLRPSSRAAIHPISSGPSDCCFGCFTAPHSSSTTTTSVRSCTNRGFRTGMRSSTGCSGSWSVHHEDGRPCDLHQRLLPTDRPRSATASHPERVTVVRTGPDLTRLRRTAADPSLRGSSTHLAAYLGVMGPQDGVDLVLELADHVVHRARPSPISASPSSDRAIASTISSR